MTNQQPASGTATGLPDQVRGMKKTTVDTPSGSYSFYRESDADLATTEGRIDWFCAHFEVEPPMLTYDPDEPNAVLLTDELLEWVKIEGASIDWLFTGAVSGALAAYREKYRITPQKAKWTKIVGEFDDTEKRIISAGLSLVLDAGADMDAVMQQVAAQVGEYRKTRAEA
ncbi:hypothetical protein Q4543_04675 [Salipiger sp. 1_MG-2023]|uniref:hypothetical protein n=1 Tax=Salipiger sp. 1_MG-2023 TaxID=3062665 RepID=UPI0026E42D65|nr:hypothetical protein [Salipiger sp. 1_MG-2023]MDO6584806.1 hypothetical protein [Salipiger sp. 1_MG-2023]